MSLLKSNRKLLIIAAGSIVVLVAAIALGLIWLLPDSSSATSAPRMSSASQDAARESNAIAVDAGRLKSELSAAGLDLKQMGVEGTALNVVMTSSAVTVDNAIEQSIRGLTLERIAQRNGVTYINCVNETDAGRVSGGIPIIALRSVKYASPDDALAAVDAWTAEIGSKHNVKTAYTFKDYRLDAIVTGRTEDLEGAVETLLLGAFGMFSKGNLDLVTIVARSETGEIVFEGVTDCLVSQTIKSWTTDKFDANAF